MEVQSLNKWKYGLFWEEYPIKEKEIWDIGKNRLCVADIIKDKEAILKDFFIKDAPIGMSYIDPPWDNSNLNSYYTKAGMKEIRESIDNLIVSIIDIIINKGIPINYMEMGNRKIEIIKDIIISKGGIITNEWEVVYYREFPSRLIRYVLDKKKSECHINFTGLDDNEIPMIAINYEDCNAVLDLCAGRGLTGRCAHKLDKIFYGIELNKRRLAVLIDYYIKADLEIREKGRLNYEG